MTPTITSDSVPGVASVEERAKSSPTMIKRMAEAYWRSRRGNEDSTWPLLPSYAKAHQMRAMQAALTTLAESAEFKSLVQDACCEARNSYISDERGGPDPDEHWANVIALAVAGSEAAPPDANQTESRSQNP